jgi:hypothetical protein
MFSSERRTYRLPLHKDDVMLITHLEIVRVFISRTYKAAGWTSVSKGWIMAASVL